MKEDFNELKPRPAPKGPDEKRPVSSRARNLFQKDSVFLLTLTLFLVTVVVAVLLGAVNMNTAPAIEKIQIEATREAMAAVLPADEYVPAPEAPNVYEAFAEGSLIGYAVEQSPPGYGGPISMIVGVSLEGKVTGVSIVKHSETPGFGTRALSEPWFLEQFADKDASLALGNGVDALSGATVTSRAVTEGVKSAVTEAMKHMNGEGGGDS